jgi:hypothetical protein
MARTKKAALKKAGPPDPTMKCIAGHVDDATRTEICEIVDRLRDVLSRKVRSNKHVHKKVRRHIKLWIDQTLWVEDTKEICIECHTSHQANLCDQRKCRTCCTGCSAPRHTAAAVGEKRKRDEA